MESLNLLQYTSMEEAVLKLAGAVNVDVNPEDIEISNKLNTKGVKSRFYKARTI